MTEKPKSTKPARKRVTSRKSKAERRMPSHSEISERAYYIHLRESGSDDVANWLRAEHELTVA
jgi:hypothetical protein